MMGAPQGVIRTNISLSRELKARMDAVSETVNWSAVAASAFEAKLAEINARKEGATMDDVIARLKTADEDDSNEAQQEGRKVGDRWFRQKARPKQLRRLEQFAQDSNDYGVGLFYEVAENSAGRNGGLIGCLFNAINHEGDRSRDDDAMDFWERAIGDDAERLTDPDFAFGFVEGALDLWSEIKGKL